MHLVRLQRSATALQQTEAAPFRDVPQLSGFMFLLTMLGLKWLEEDRVSQESLCRLWFMKKQVVMRTNKGTAAATGAAVAARLESEAAAVPTVAVPALTATEEEEAAAAAATSKEHSQSGSAGEPNGNASGGARGSTDPPLRASPQQLEQPPERPEESVQGDAVARAGGAPCLSAHSSGKSAGPQLSGIHSERLLAMMSLVDIQPMRIVVGPCAFTSMVNGLPCYVSSGGCCSLQTFQTGQATFEVAPFV